MHFKALLLASLLLGAVVGAARPNAARADERLLIDAPDALWPAWQAFVVQHPLPPGVTARRAAPGDAPDAAAGEDAPRLQLRIGPIPGFRAVARVAAAPTATLGDPRTSATLAEVRAGRLPVEPVSAIVPPRVALPVDGAYPGDPEYPIYDEIDAALVGSNGAAAQWLQSLPSASDSGGAVASDRDSVAWIGAVGDIMPGRGVDLTLLSGAGGVERVFGDTLPVLRSFSLLLGNLEATATGSGPRANKSYTFRFDARAVSSLVSSASRTFPSPTITPSISAPADSSKRSRRSRPPERRRRESEQTRPRLDSLS